VARIIIVIVALGATALAGCERESGLPGTAQRDARLVANVVARVGDGSIGAADVEARLAAEGIGPEAALRELIDEELLVQEAERLGFAEGRDAERAIERLMVRMMLRDLEEESTPESISDKEVREDYAQHAEKFQVPERRRSWHILVSDSSEAGRALAQSILGELRRADDPKTVYERYAADDSDSTEPEVRAEELPAIAMKASMEKPYKDALFAAKSEGPLKKIVKTSYGWHAIVLTEILPGEHRTVDDMAGETRERLSQQKRFETLVELVRALEGEGLVQYDEQGVEHLLSTAGLPERAE